MASDFTDSLHPVVADYRKRLADQGLFDERDDFQVVRFLAQQNPKLLDERPDFGQLYGQIREANAPGLMEEGTRAFKRAGIGLGSTALGGAALVTGSDYLKRKAAALSMQASDPDLAPTIPTLEDIQPGNDRPTQAFSRDALRYGISKVGEAVPSIGEAVALGLVGGAIGSAVEPGAGTAIGAGAGVVEGLLGRGLIRKAIKSLVSKELGEEAIVAGLRKGVPEVVEAVTKNAKSLAGARAGTVTAGLNSFLLNAGDVYAENDDRGIAAGLGLISAVPDTVLPALVVRKMFPGVSLRTGKEAARELVGSNALKLAKAAGVTTFEGATESFQEAVNVVARNLKDGVDPLAVTDADKIRIREAGITGAVGGALASPAVVLERDAEEITQAPEAPPPAPTAVPPVPPVAPVVAPTLLPTQRVRAMTPEQQVARLAELETRARVGDEEAEYQILKATVPTQAQQPITPAVEAAVQEGNLPLAPTDVPPTELGALTPPEPAAPVVTPATPEEEAAAQRAQSAASQFAAGQGMVGAPIAPELTLPPPADVAGSETPIPGVDVAPVAATPLPPTWRVTVQEAPNRPSIVQIDMVDEQGQNAGSTSPQALTAQGYAVPDFTTLPQGQYTVAEINQPSTPAPNAGQIESTTPLGQLPGGQESLGLQGSQGVERSLQGPQAAGAVAPEVGGKDVGVAPAFRTTQTETPEFRAWFGNSKVVDAEGKPMVVYHGTYYAPDFAAFDKSKRGASMTSAASKAFFFTDSNDVADNFSGVTAPGARTIPVHLSLQNPLIVNHAKRTAQEMLRRGHDVRRDEINRAIREGHDGVIFKDTFDFSGADRITVYAAFEPTQIKSAIGNRGTFDPQNPDITARSVSVDAQPTNASTGTQDNPTDDSNPLLLGIWSAPRGDNLGNAGRERVGGEEAPVDREARLPQRVSAEPTNPAVQAQRTKEFQAVMGRLVANGANVQAMSRELLAQQTGEVLQQQISALQQRLAQATTAPQRNELTAQLALRQERLAEVAQMRGVTFSPYHIAVAMDDVMNASLDNLVTLLHEAAESLTMRLSPAQQGAVFRAVEATTAQMMARMQAAAKTTGATVANVPVPSEVLAETMAQTLAAEGISDAPSLAQAIVRWIKEIYYRVAMAAQRAFGAEPNPELALGWYENQLRRELGGDYSYALGSLLDRFLPQSNTAYAQKFSGATGTPGGMPDFFDPVSQKLTQPWIEPLSDEALAWNMRFQTVGVNPGESEGIPAEEAIARQTAAAYNEQIKWLTKLHGDIAPTMDMAEFLGLVSRGEKTPHEMLDVLKTASPGVETAVIGGERMTDAMNKWAAHQTLLFMKGVQAKHLSKIAQMQEAIAEADEKFTEHAAELNRLEPDVKNAELHEGILRAKAKAIIEGLYKSINNGYRTSSKLGMMVEAEENLGDRDPLPQFYAQTFMNLLNAQVPLFDYVEAIALLDLPVEDMTPEQVWAAIRENADTSEKLRELSRNKPLAMTVSVLARNSARQLDQIQLRRADAETFLDIRKELEGIRNATEAQMRVIFKTLDEKNTAKGLRQRLRTAYIKERRALKRASDRIAQVETRIDVLEKAKPAVAEKVAEMQQAIGGVFSEWTPGDNIEFTVMRRRDDGSFQRESRTLHFNKDGSAEDSAGILNDLAQNEQWLKANVARAGQKEYEQVKHQTRALQNMDVQRAYQSHNYGKVMGMIDKFVRPLLAIAKQAGHASGSRVVQQMNKYEFINRSGAKALTNQSYEWGAAMTAVMKSMGIEDVGQFRAQIYNPVMFYLGVNPGLTQAQAIRGGIAEARKHLAKPPAANFNERMEAFILKTKEINSELLKTAEQNGVLVWDEKLGELRKAIDRGWLTGMRMMNDGVVVTLIHDMEKAGWKLDFDKDEMQKRKKVVTRSTTFDALNPENAKSPEERAQYYAQLENTDALRAALKPYFTPAVLQRWLLPFINKPGESVFSYDGRDIPQIDLQNAWAKAGGDVVTWIDNLGKTLEVEPDEDASAAATFRWDMLRQLEHLFRWEAGMAYEAEQTPDLFNSQGSKLHVMMDARVNDIMPAEHINFAMHDPKSVQQMLGQIAFHGAFGRNGSALMANLKELEAVSVAKKLAFDSLQSTTVEGRKREAKAKGYDYDDLRRAVDHYHDVLELKGEIEAAMGVKNIYGPLYDARAGMELLGFMVGQVVDQPKTAGLNFLSIGARPFAMHSFSPKVLKGTALAYGELAKNTFGGLLRDFGIDLVRMSDFARETGEVEGKAFRRLPWGVVMTGDTGKEGSFQQDLASRAVIKPLRIFRAIQKKGVGPGLASIPGLGTMQRFATEGAMANNIGQIYLLQEIINNGIRHFSAHPEDLANPAFRFNETNLRLRGDRGMYDWFRNKTVEYNMGPIERIVREAMERQKAGERTITTEMVEQLAQMNAQELDGASSINTAPAGLAQNQALKVMLPLLRWPLWMMHAAHEGLADANGRADFKSMLRGLGRLAAWNLPIGLAFTFLIDEYDEKILRKKNAMPAASKLSTIPVVGVPLALATTPREIPQEMLAIGQRMIRAGNIYGLGGDAAQLIIAPFDPGSGQRAFSLDQRVLIMSQLLNLTQATSNWVNQGVPTWGSVWRPMVASIGGNGMLNSLDVVNNVLGLDNAESRLTTRINAARWVNTAAKELGYETKKASGFSSPTPMSVWTREMQLAAMANSRADFMEAYRKALQAAREKVAEDDRIAPENREREALARVLASWRARNPFSGLATTATLEQQAAMLRVMNDQGRQDVQDAMRYYDAYTQLIKPSDMDRYLERRMRTVNPAQQIESLRRRAAGAMMGR